MRIKTRTRLFGVIASLVLLLTMIFGMVTHTSAATYADVTVTASPNYIAISNAGGNWTINSLTGDSKVDPNTTYYSNPLGDTTAPSATVVDGECKWTITDTSSVRIDMKVTMTDFTGGDASTNSGTGSNGATSYGAYAWYSGMTYSNKKVVKTSGSDTLYTSGSAGAGDIKWGVEVKTQSNAWGSGDDMTATLTITATKKV